ncbi:hypothetical protein [Sulfurihydrogenibium azorense]|nr:hypothetical protein [Sulfurihydrogenibium azorense]
MDLAAYCVENPPTDTGQITIDQTNGKNCASPVNTPGGQVTISVANINCQDSGSLTGGTVTAALSGVSDYKAVCTAKPEGFKCTVQ